MGRACVQPLSSACPALTRITQVKGCSFAGVPLPCLPVRAAFLTAQVASSGSAHNSQISGQLFPKTPVHSVPSSRRTVAARASGSEAGGYGGLPLVQQEEQLLLEDDQLPEYAFAVLGDLHLVPQQMEVFNEGRGQVISQLTAPGGDLLPEAQVFQLGDLGDYASHPGSMACFKLAKEYLDSYKLPYNLVTGNHDLEGLDDFESDSLNLAAWRDVFERNHYWKVEMGGLGGPVCIGLSTVRFRDAEHSCHEVYIDAEQIRWFVDTLARYKDRPVFVFTHAPPICSGLVALQEVHVRNRCAWLNHSSEPEVFADITAQNPQIKLWFSGHYHLSHDYARSVSRVGRCLYVQVGVMGHCHRDGKRQSRLVKGTSKGYQLYTVDHDDGSLRLDVVHHYSNSPEASASDAPTYTLPFWLATSPACPDTSVCPKGGYFAPTLPGENDWVLEAGGVLRATTEGGCVKWLKVGDIVLAQNGNMLVEYDLALGAPIGTVCDRVDAREIRLVVQNHRSTSGSSAGTSGLQEEDAVRMSNGASSSQDEADELVAVELVGPGAVGGAMVNIIQGRGTIEERVERFEKNKDGEFWQIYQVNKYKVWKSKKEAKELAALAQSRS